MPSRPLKPCGHPGCDQLAETGRCEAHAIVHKRQKELWRGSAASRGYGYRHQQERVRHLREHPLCARCLQQGRVTSASVLDHRLPIRVRPDLQHDPKNWQGLCADCHAIKTAEDQRKYPEYTNDE